MGNAEQGQDFTNLEQLIDQILAASQSKGQVMLDDILNMVGRRSFGPLLLLAGLLTLAPIIGDIPGAPTVIGVFVFLLALQLLLGRDYFWLPDWLLCRSISGENVQKGLGYLYPPARFIDRFLKPRLFVLVDGYAQYMIALTALAIALCMPVMEVVPFSANAAGIVLVGFGLSMIARDGLLVLVSYGLTVATFGLVVFGVL
ncbi:MAG: exopolysaccharide biosynthesis protein [Haliea sp.]